MSRPEMTIGDIAEWLEENYPGSDVAEGARALASEPDDMVDIATTETWSSIDYPVIDGFAVLADGRRIPSSAKVVRVAVLTEKPQ